MAAHGYNNTAESAQLGHGYNNTAASLFTSAGSAQTTWEQIVEEMANMKPHFASCAKEAAEFAAAWSGDDTAPGLNDAEAYATSLKVRKEPEDGQLGTPLPLGDCPREAAINTPNNRSRHVRMGSKGRGSVYFS